MWLDNCDCPINQWQKFVRGDYNSCFKKLVRTKKVLKVVKLSGRYDILASIEKNYHIEAIKQIEAFKWLHG